MDKKTVLKALRSPYKPVLDYALTYVALSDKERLCVSECVIKDNTEEETAYKIQRSRDFVAKHKKKGIDRICKAWNEIPEIVFQLSDY